VNFFNEVIAKRLHQFSVELETNAAGYHLRGQLVPSDVGHAISEAIDMDYSRLELRVLRLLRVKWRQPDDIRDSHSQRGGFDTPRKCRGDGCENVAPVEGRAHGMTKVFRVSELEYLERCFRFEMIADVAKDSIVRANKKLLAGLDQYWPSR